MPYFGGLVMRGGAPPCLAALLKFTRFSFRRDGVRRGRRTQAGAEKSPRCTLCVCPAREPARWQRRAAAPPGAPLKAAPLSALSGRFLVQGESVRSPHVLVQRWVLGAQPADRCAPARASFCPLICLPKPEGASTCFRQKPRLPPRAGSLDFCSLFTPKDGRIRRCGEQKCRLC